MEGDNPRKQAQFRELRGRGADGLSGGRHSWGGRAAGSKEQDPAYDLELDEDLEDRLVGLGAELSLASRRRAIPGILGRRLALTIGFDLKAIEPESVLGQRTAQRVLLRFEPLAHRRQVGLHVCLEPAVLDAQ